MEGVFDQNVSDQERVCQTLQLHQWWEYWLKNVSVKLFSFFSGGSIGDQERVCQTLQLH